MGGALRTYVHVIILNMLRTNMYMSFTEVLNDTAYMYFLHNAHTYGACSVNTNYMLLMSHVTHVHG